MTYMEDIAGIEKPGEEHLEMDQGSSWKVDDGRERNL
jgi:hypothetical protein